MAVTGGSREAVALALDVLRQGQAQDRQIAEDLGASSFITKPYANADVVGTVKRLLAEPKG